MNRFEALEVSLELAKELAPFFPPLNKRNPSLCDQLRRACVSVASNLAEGSRRVGKDRSHHFRTAEGSAAEVCVQLKLAASFGDLKPEQVARALELADRVTAMCYCLTRDRSRGG